MVEVSVASFSLSGRSPRYRGASGLGLHLDGSGRSRCHVVIADRDEELPSVCCNSEGVRARSGKRPSRSR